MSQIRACTFIFVFLLAFHALEVHAQTPLLEIIPNCAHAQFNTTGSKLFYSCQQKERHSQFQIYERDTATNMEKRISFNDGDSIFPLPVRDQLYYFSTTDNVKRVSYEATTTSTAYPDLFSLDLKSKEITALTKQNTPRMNPQVSPFSVYWSESSENQIKWLSLDIETQKIRTLKLPSTLVVQNLIQIGKQDWILISASEILRWNERSAKAPESVLKAETGLMRPSFFSHNQDGAIVQLKTPIKLANSETASDLIWISSKDTCAMHVDNLPKNLRSLSVNPNHSDQAALTLVQEDKFRVEVKSLKIDLGTCGSVQISSKLEK